MLNLPSSPPCPGPPVVVLANRAPFRYERGPDGTIVERRSASGLVTAVEPILKVCSGVWVAHVAGGPDATLLDPGRRPKAPPGKPEYRLRGVSLPDDEYRGYYYGFANEGLWPLCHRTPVRPAFRATDFRAYRQANRRFAEVACDEAERGAPVVFVHDYHLALAPRLVRDRLPALTVVAFWHIPWPHADAFGTCPWSRDLLDGLLGADIIGLQTPQDCANLLQCVESTLPCEVDRRRGAVRYRNRWTSVRAYPVGIEWDNAFVRSAPAVPVCRARVRTELGIAPDVQMGVGIDRLDYTKGLHEKFLAVERLLETRPEFQGRFTFVQVAEPSRDCLSAYREARAQLLNTAHRVNERFGTGTCRPIVLLEGHRDPADVYRFYRAADVCYVGSLHDGMNLVAKEFVCARDDERGVLVLSRFAGASRQLRGAVRVNPCVVDESAQALARALTMPDREQSGRMRQMRHVVARFDARWWAERILHDARLLQEGGSEPADMERLAADHAPA